MRSWLIAMLLLSAVLAGCSEPGPTDDPGDDQDGSGDPTGDNNGTTDPVANNTAPVANLTADVLNGTAPLLVNLTLDGSDADADNLTWTLTLGNGTANGTAVANGTSFPATLNFTLDAGNHTFLLTVTDGNLTTTANLTVLVAAAAVEEADPNAPVDMGWYIFDPATALCHVKNFQDIGGAGVLYRSALSGGDWFLAEDNGVPGLQIEDNHPYPSAPVIGNLFGLDLPDCVDGDLIVL